MPAKILNGVKVAEEIKAEVIQLAAGLNFKPKLDIVLVGRDEASKVYVRNKVRNGNQVGIDIFVHEINECNTDDLRDLIIRINNDVSVHGVIVQLPLPLNIDRNYILGLIDPIKDVDCLSPANLGLLHYKPQFLPPTANAVMLLLKHYNIPILGKNIVIINDTVLLGRPLSALLINAGGTVTICNEFTENLIPITYLADVIVVAVGKRPNFILDKKYCKNTVKIIDCGVNKSPNMDGKVVGDVDIKSVLDIADAVSCVPGGVGPCTIACLLRNVIEACRLQNNA